MTPRLPSRRNERGAVLIEFALVVPLLLVLTLSVIDISRAFFVKNILYQAAREGARTAAVMTTADEDAIKARVTQVASAANVAISTITISGPVDRQLNVVVESSFTWILPGLFGLLDPKFGAGIPLKASAWMRQETP